MAPGNYLLLGSALLLAYGEASYDGDTSQCIKVEEGWKSPSLGHFQADGWTHWIIVPAGMTAPLRGTFCDKSERACMEIKVGDPSGFDYGFFMTDAFIKAGVTGKFVARGKVAPMAGTLCNSTQDEWWNMEGKHSARLIVQPQWTSFSSFDQPKGKIAGSMTVGYEWWFSDDDQYKVFGPDGFMAGYQPWETVSITNFATGTPGRVQSADFATPYQTVNYKIEYHRTSVVYVGDFYQGVDGTCYPWDEQRVYFNFSLVQPFNAVMTLALGCSEGDHACKPYYCGEDCGEQRDKMVPTLSHSKQEGVESKGYIWSVFKCEVYNDKTIHDSIRCEMVGRRYFTKTVTLQIIPGVVMCIIGFSSFLIPDKMAMPRVASTMIALLTFVGKGTSVVSSMPTTGMSIVEEFYIWGVGTMFVNMMGHIISWQYPKMSPLIAELQLGFTVFLFVLVLSVSMHARHCAYVAPEVTTSIIVLSSVLLFASASWSIKRHWKDFLVIHAKAKSKILKQAPEDAADDPDGDFFVAERDVEAPSPPQALGTSGEITAHNETVMQTKSPEVNITSRQSDNNSIGI